MLRWSRPGDEAGIFDLVRNELVPLSPRRIRSARLRQEVLQRLRRGVTIVAAENRTSKPFAFVHVELRQPTLFIDLLAVDASRKASTGAPN